MNKLLQEVLLDTSARQADTLKTNASKLAAKEMIPWAAKA